jgi:hypothetical protein
VPEPERYAGNHDKDPLEIALFRQNFPYAGITAAASSLIAAFI